MNKDQIRGKWEELKGRFKKAYGEATADRKTQAEGAVQERVGKAQGGIGKVVEEVKDTRGEPPPEERR